MPGTLKPHFIEARDLPDSWIQAVPDVIDVGRRSKVDKGSFEGDTRLQYDYFIGHVHDPGHGSGTPEILPDIPAHIGIPNPVDFNYVYGGDGHSRSYLEYVMTDHKEPGESYTYGERLTKAPLNGDKLTWWEQGNEDIVNKREMDGKIVFEEDGQLYLHQINWIIDEYKHGHGNNQLVL